MIKRVYYIYDDIPCSIEDWALVSQIAWAEQGGIPCICTTSAKSLPECVDKKSRKGGIYVGGKLIELISLRSALFSTFYDRVVVAYRLPFEKLMDTMGDARCVIYVGPKNRMTEDWLVAHEAVSVRTRESLKCVEHPSVVMRRALDWLDKTSFPGSHMLHPFDNDRLSSVANALYDMGEPLRPVAMMHYCINLGWPEYTIYRCFATFNKAHDRHIKVEGSYTVDTFVKLWNLKPEDMQKKSYIHSFCLNSMWGYKTVNWENVKEDVNILVGINGVGKTTLLDAMYNYYTGAKMPRKAKVENAIPKANMALPISYIRTPDSPALDKKVRESRLTQELTGVIMQNKEGNSFYNYLMRQVYETSENVLNIKKNVEQLFMVINRFFMETGKTVFVDKDNNSVLSFHIKGCEDTINHTQLSSGEKQLLLILIRVFLQEKRPAILFMDEPEISLHIRWQQMLIDAIRQLNPQCQILLTTHSPSILSRGWGDKVVYMEDIVTGCNK